MFGRRKKVKEEKEEMDHPDTNGGGPGEDETEGPPQPRQMGWGSEATEDSDIFANKEREGAPRAGRRAGGGGGNSGDPEMTSMRRRHDEVTTEVMDIPDLDGDPQLDDDEDFQRQVAAPPKARANRVQSIRELDSTVQFQLPMSKDNEIDLSLLIGALCPVDKVKEEDTLWEPEQLLSEVAFEIQQEREQMEEKEEEDGEGADAADPRKEEQSLFNV